jgi:hypothetical protein
MKTDEVNGQMTEHLAHANLCTSHPYCCQCIKKFSLVCGCIPPPPKKNGHLRNWYMQRQGGRGATLSLSGRAVTGFEME